VGKILRLTLDGKPARAIQWLGRSARDDSAHRSATRHGSGQDRARRGSTYTFPGPNLAPSETWTSGHRTPYGLAFARMGGCGKSSTAASGDELKPDRACKNYGWPLRLLRRQLRTRADSSPDERPDWPSR